MKFVTVLRNLCHKNHDDCSEAKFLPIFPTCIDAYCLINIKRQFITISLGLFLGPRSNWPFNNIQNVWKKGQRKNSPARKGMRSHNPWNQSAKLHLVIHQQICITFRFGYQQMFRRYFLGSIGKKKLERCWVLCSGMSLGMIKGITENIVINYFGITSCELVHWEMHP